MKEDNKEIEEEFYVNVLIKDQKFKIYCGSGNQTIRWLTDNAIFKYEYYYGGKCGLAFGLKLENGNLCDLREIINTILKNEANAWVLLKEEFDLYTHNVTENI